MSGRRRGWRVAAIAITASCCAVSTGQAAVRWFDGSFEHALERAASDRKLLLLDAWATWCRFCHQMDRDVWGRDDVGRAVERAAIAYHPEVDVVAGIGSELAGRFAIEGLPVTLLIDPRDARVLARLEGYQSAAAVLGALDRTWSSYQQALESAPRPGSPGFALAEGGRALRAGDLAKARAAARSVLALDPDCRRDDADDAALLLADLELQVGRAEQALAALRGVIESCHSATGTRELWRRYIELSGSVVGPAAAAQATLARAARFAADGIAQRDAARSVLDSGGAVEEAERFARAAIAVLPDDPSVLAVLAEVLLRARQFDEARRTIDRAIEIDPHDPALRELRLKIVLAARQAEPAR